MLRGLLATPLITTSPPQQPGTFGHQYGSQAAYPAGMPPCVPVVPWWAGGPKAYQPVMPARIASTTKAATSSILFRRPAGGTGPVPSPPVNGSWTAVLPGAPVAAAVG